MLEVGSISGWSECTSPAQDESVTGFEVEDVENGAVDVSQVHLDQPVWQKGVTIEAFVVMKMRRSLYCRRRDGARYRVRTCDPYRVKVVLYH